MTSAVLAAKGSHYAGEAVRVLTAHRWFILVVLVYVLCGLVASNLHDLPERMSLSLYSVVNLQLMLGFLGVFALGYPLYVMIAKHPRRLVRYIIDDLWNNYLTTERVFGGLIMMALLPVYLSVFTGFKTMISATNPFLWDPTFEIWDRWLHFGLHPWQILQPLLGHPYVTSAINILYQFWLVLLYVLLFWQAFSTRDPRLRMQFFLTFVLSWALLGSLLATILSSGGPVYYGRLTGLPDPYIPLMEYLYAAREVAVVWVLKVQEGLWNQYLTGVYNYGSGISAMPSIHVSAATLFALLGWAVNRILGIALSVFAVIIMIGSVHLAWHYAVDGYVSALLTWLIWRFCGWWVARDPSFAREPVRTRA